MLPHTPNANKITTTDYLYSLIVPQNPNKHLVKFHSDFFTQCLIFFLKYSKMRQFAQILFVQIAALKFQSFVYFYQNASLGELSRLQRLHEINNL